MSMKNILISGGTGFVGKALIAYLLEHFPDVTLTVLVRSKRNLDALPRVRYCLWDVDKQFIDPSLSEDIDTIIHLAGANIAEKRWTRKRKELLLKSRTESGKLLVDWIMAHGREVKTFVSASAIGWYGAGTAAQLFKEDDPAGDGFLADVCRKWEATTAPLIAHRIRVAWIRTGLVLHPSGGMWKALSTAFRFGIAPRFASGRQCFSWIGLADLVSLYAFVAAHDHVVGPVNAVAPHPVSQLSLTKALLAKQSSSALVVPVPSFVLKWALGELSIELLKNAAVSADKIQQAGFQFSAKYPSDL